MNLELNQVVAVVLAGGFGTRVAHLLPGIPKPMAQVAGRPFLEWVVRFLARQGIENVVLSTGHLAEVVEEHFQKNPVPGVRTRSIAETQPLGTAGGFLNAARFSGEKPPAWLVLNGDSLVLSDLARRDRRTSRCLRRRRAGGLSRSRCFTLWNTGYRCGRKVARLRREAAGQGSDQRGGLSAVRGSS